MRQRVEYDLYYIDNWSLWLDLTDHRPHRALARGLPQRVLIVWTFFTRAMLRGAERPRNPARVAAWCSAGRRRARRWLAGSRPEVDRRPPKKKF